MEIVATILMQSTASFESGSSVQIGLNYPIMDNEEKDQGWRKELSDQELVALVQQSREGDLQAMGTLYEHFKASLFSLALRYTYNFAAAEDVIQDVFVKVFTNLHTLDEDKAFVGWLFRIAVNTCLSYLRSHKKVRQKTISLEDVQGIVADTAPTATEKAESKLLEDSIQKLPPRLKSVFLLHDVQGFKHHEIAHILGCSVGTSKSQLFKARKRIRKHLEHKQWL
jgi:RNA polymerase sigma-70 factor (ECF subfamily)